MKKVLAGVVVVLLAITLVKGVEIVDAGHTGVKKTLGKIDEGTLLPPGFHVVNPLTTTVIQMDNRVARTDNETVAYTKDVQRAKISYTMNYSLQSQSSASILNTVGADYRNKVIPQVIYGSIK
jgi:regulator of protease activity HflC (stomatin/prohibitin superfamily)